MTASRPGLLRGVVQPGQRAGVALADRACCSAIWTLCRVEQAQRIGDRRPRATDSLADLLVGEPELVDQLAEGACFLERVQIRSLQVLDERPGELRASSALRTSAGIRSSPAISAARRRRSPAISWYPPALGVTRTGCSTPCSAMLAARLPAGLVDRLAWLVRVAADRRDRQLDGAHLFLALRDQGGEAAARPDLVRRGSAVMRGTGASRVEARPAGVGPSDRDLGASAWYACPPRDSGL